MISKSNYCQIKEILYPDINKKPLKNFIPKNFYQIKIIQKQNSLKKQQKEKEKELNENSK